MAIKHAKVSGKPAPADPSLVGGPEWDANHVIDDATITYAKIQNVTATSRVLARKTAGAGVIEEVLASDVLDFISSTNGAILCRRGGFWAPLTRVVCDGAGDDLLLTAVTDPLQPSGGLGKPHMESVGGRIMLACRSGHLADDIPSHRLQPFIAQANLQVLIAEGAGSNVLSRWGTQVPWTGGTLTGRNWANTNFYTQSKRVGFVSAAGAGSVAYVRHEAQTWRGNAAGLGGFHVVIRFAITDGGAVATARMFAGIGANANPTDVDPSTLTDIVGIGHNNGDTQLQLYAAGNVAQARTSLGANFPSSTLSTDVYELTLFSAPNGSRIEYLVRRLNTGHTASGTITAGANLITSNLSRAPQVWRSNGGTAAAVAFDLMSMYVESGA